MNNMKKFLILFVGIIFLNVGCSSDEAIITKTVEEVVVKNKIDFKINGQIPANSIRNLTASFCCNNNISVSFDHWVSTSNGLGYGGSAFNVSLDRNGNLLGLHYKDYTDPNNEFSSALFVPISTLTVNDFQFAENQSLKLKIAGKIFKQTYNFFTQPEFVNIDADIDIKDFNKCFCGSFSSTLKTNNNLLFNQISKSQQGNNIKYLAYTNNGYQIEFLNFSQSLQDLPIGLYSFTENSTSQRIDFRKFIGVPRNFAFSIISQEWLKYDTSGTFEIVEKRQLVSGEIVTKVKFNLVAKFNNQIIFNFENAIFETQM